MMMPISLQDVEILNSIGIIYNETNQYELSIKTYEKAIKHLKDIVDVPDRKVEIRIYYGLAKSLFKNGNFIESMKFCNKGINLCLNEDLLYLLGELNYELGQNYHALKQNDHARKHFSTSLQLFQLSERSTFIEVIEKRISSLDN